MPVENRMAQFDALGEVLFKKDVEGNTVFYKWGVLGRGVIIDTEERKVRIVAFVSRYYLLTFALIFLMQFLILVMHREIIQTTLLFLGIALVMAGWYLQAVGKLTHGLEYSTTRLTMENSWQTTAGKMPRYVIVGGFIAMILLSGFSLAALFFLDGGIRWAALFLLAVGAFGTYAYHRMLVYAKEVKSQNSVVVTISPGKSKSESIAWTPKNVAIIATLLVAVTGLVYYSYADSKQGFDERMARYNAMTTEEMAAHLAEVNAEPEQIDPITRHAGTKAEGTTITFYRELSSNILSDLVVDTQDLEEEQLKMTHQLRREMCGSPTYDLFYDKGGSLIFSYQQVGDGSPKFLFNVKVDKVLCG